MKYFVFGDIHGHLDPLLRLLKQIDVDPQNVPDNVHLVFVGDLIDRGPQSREVVTLVKELVESGKASCVMANHEFNFVNFNTRTSPTSDQYRRPRNDKNLTEIAETWASYRIDGRFQKSLIKEHVDWFKSLPIALEFEGFNVIHACWHEPSLNMLEKRDNGYFLSDSQWESAWVENSPLGQAIETLCKGAERTLPNGITFSDPNGVERNKARVCWWNREPSSWVEYMRAPGVDMAQFERLDVPSNQEFTIEKPTLFGHYWMTGVPSVLSSLTACLDFSIAANPMGYLACYEFRSGDTELSNDRLHFVQG